jgi:hypothetical protein
MKSLAHEKWSDEFLLSSHKDISVENVSLMYELSEGFNAMSLRESCILFILEQFDKLCTKPWYVFSMHLSTP